MQFKSPEYFWLSIFGLTIIAGVSSRSILKGLMSGILGLLISTIGMYNGVNTTCALIGLFSMSQVFILAEKKILERAKAAKFKMKYGLTRQEIKRIMPTITRSWLIGNIMGILPGAGATIACFMGYNEARRFSKHKEEFGNGSIEGVAGSDVDLRDSRRVCNGCFNGWFDYPWSSTGTGTFLHICSDDLHVLCWVCFGAICHARDRLVGQ